MGLGILWFAAFGTAESAGVLFGKVPGVAKQGCAKSKFKVRSSRPWPQYLESRPQAMQKTVVNATNKKMHQILSNSSRPKEINMSKTRP
jgi:hypothetical protein